MCLNPIMIDNPYKGLKHVGLNRFHDCTSLKIPVPCGNCSVCVALKQSYFIQRTQMEQLHNFLFMLTLTYNRESLPVIDVNGYKYSYALWSDFQKMIRRIRKKKLTRPFKYFAVSEFGSEKHRIHFHAILSFPRLAGEDDFDAFRLEREYFKIFLNNWKRRVGGTNRKPIFQDLCTYIKLSNGKSTYDFHYIDPRRSKAGEDDVCFYVTKYVTKSDKWLDKVKSAMKFNLSPEDFQKVFNGLIKPKVCCSKNWGSPDSPSVKKYIRKGIDLALKNKDFLYPVFINRHSGQTFPLSPFYKSRFLTMNDNEVFYLRSPDKYLDSINDFFIDASSNRSSEEKFSKVRSLINATFLNPDVYDFIEDKELSCEVQETYNFDSCGDSFVDDDWQSDFILSD